MSEYIRGVTRTIDDFTARPSATMLAFLLTLTWFAVGPHLRFSPTWQLFMTTPSAVVTFLMVFVIANAQHRNTMALHLKIDMLVAAHPELTNKAVGAEHAADGEVAEVREELARMIREGDEGA